VSLLGEDSFDFKIYMPTVGVGFAYPLTEDIAVGIQGGIGLAHFRGIDADNSAAYNLEATVNIVPRENLIIQFGYRYQKFSFDLQPSDLKETFKSGDSTCGPTLMFIYSM
jgi:opacity protein-like surface antigen